MILRFLAVALFAVTQFQAKLPLPCPLAFSKEPYTARKGRHFRAFGRKRARSGAHPWVTLKNSDSWAPLAADLMKDHTVVVARTSVAWAFLQACRWLR